jgi:hypothetical protein
MSSITSGTFPFQNSTQDAYSNYENPAFRIRIRDIRDTGVQAVDDLNDVDYSKQLNVGEIVMGKMANKKSEKIYKGVITSIAVDERGNKSTVTIRSDGNKEIQLDPDSVLKVKEPGQITDIQLLGYHDNFYVPGPSKNMSEPQKITGESLDTSRRIKTFLEFRNGM